MNKEFTQRFTDNGREIAINVKGEVNVYDDASVSGDLKFDDDAELRAYLRSQEKELRIIWNASGCQVMDGAGVQECSRDQRRLIVSAIKKRPKTPTPP